MNTQIWTHADTAARWVNQNQGLVSIGIFFATLFLGWTTGLFSALKKRPKFLLDVISGPTFSCTFPTGEKHGPYEVHRTAIAVYLRIANIGNAPSSVHRISIAYHWNIIPLKPDWWKYRVGWFWLDDQSIALEDFQLKMGDSIKFFPFLIQRSGISLDSQDSYLEIGKSVNGVAYFEQPDSFGGCFPLSKGSHIAVKIRVEDVFGKKHVKRFQIPTVSLDEAMKWNPSFSKTLEVMRERDIVSSASHGEKY